MARIGFYPGSFDPPTYGHLDIIKRASKLVDHLMVAIGAHHEKTGFLSIDERISLLEAECGDIAKSTNCEITITTFDGLVVAAAASSGAGLLIRGLRDGRDFDYERQMAGMNSAMAGDIETVFLAAAPGTSFIASSLVKQIAVMGGDVSKFVPTNIAKAIRARVNKG